MRRISFRWHPYAWIQRRLFQRAHNAIVFDLGRSARRHTAEISESGFDKIRWSAAAALKAMTAAWAHQALLIQKYHGDAIVTRFAP